MTKTKKAVLIIDDSPSIRTFLKISVADAGWTPLEAGSVSGGIEMLQEENPDLVILDLGLPDGDGMDVLDAVRQSKAAEPSTAPTVIVLTVRKDPETKRRALAMGAAHFMTKPFDVENLMDVIDRCNV